MPSRCCSSLSSSFSFSQTLTLAVASPNPRSMSNPWGAAGIAGAGAWALDAERADEEERAAAIAGVPVQNFPSLSEAAATKPKKKKPAAMSLSQFTTGAYSAPGSRSRPHADEPITLPTGPRERSAEELDQGRLGGGFRSYGAGAGGAGSGRRSYGGGFDEEQRRGPSRDSDLDLPSRADEVDNWGAGKKAFAPSPAPDSRDRDRDRYSSLGVGGPSRADELDNWSAGKKPLPPPSASRHPSFGSGFRDSSASSDSDRWGRGGVSRMDPPPSDRERPRFVVDPPKRDVGAAATEPARTGTRPSPFGAARPREEVLKEKGVDVLKLEAEKVGRPTSSHSSRPSSAQSSRPGSPSEVAAPVRVKANPFGDAKPREVLLQERGKDWRKIDIKLEHGRVNRPETNEEKLLKEEIDNLNKALVKEGEKNQHDSSSQALTDLREQINQRENELEKLICELDDKVRFGQRTGSDNRPGSAVMEFADRPRSRGGMGDTWDKQMDEKRRGGRESSFFGTRNMDRPKSREGW